MPRIRGSALAVVGLLIVISDSLDAIDDGFSIWNGVTIVIGLFLLLSGVFGLRRASN